MGSKLLIDGGGSRNRLSDVMRTTNLAKNSELGKGDERREEGDNLLLD